MNKKLFTTALLLSAIIALPTAAAEIWVDPNGNDRASGAQNEPLQSLAMALRRGRELRRIKDPSVASGVTIYLRNGRHELYEEAFIRAEDSGTESSPTIIRNAPNEHPVVSGSLQIGGWKRAGTVKGLPKEAAGKVWQTQVPEFNGRPFEFRQLWINGKKATRARSCAPEAMTRILSFDGKTESLRIPTPKEFRKGGEVSPLEMTLHQMWAIAHLRIRELKVDGDSTEVILHNPERRLQFEHPWPPPAINKKIGNSPFYLSNAIELLNEPGEWFLDNRSQTLYYYPRPKEAMKEAKAYIPTIETLVSIAGTPDRMVHNIHIEGITFEHTSWLRPSQKGHVPIQAGMYLTDGYKLRPHSTPEKRGLDNQAWHGRPPGAVHVRWSEKIRINQCTFEHLGSCGLDVGDGVKDCTIEGNLFSDIAGNGIQFGRFAEDAYEIHLVYDPTDRRELSANSLIANNYVIDCANEDWGCVGIAAGWVSNVTIRNNELTDLPYSAISLGWGWIKQIGCMRNNRVLRNKVTHYGRHMYDVAAVYTLSAQPGTLIAENSADSIYKPTYVHDPNHWFYYYTDEGSGYMQVQNNWCPAEKFLANANAPCSEWTNNGPMVNDSVRRNAGLEPQFRHRLRNRK